MKKIILFITALILLFAGTFGAISYFSANEASVPKTTAISQKTEQSETQAQSTEKETEKEENKQKDKSKEESSSKEKEASQKREAKEKEKSTKKAEKSSSKEKSTENKTTKKSKSAKPKKENACYITIECKTILNNMDKLKEGHEGFVPKNGIILQRKKYTFKDGETVFDILQKACDENGVILNARNTGYGIYVAGINNLDEFDCGKNSGWIYKVNSQAPPKSCGKYVLSQGDEIVFSYTCG